MSTINDGSLYVPQTWIDEVDNYTPITAERMNHMEQGIKACSDAWDSISPVGLRVAANGNSLNDWAMKAYRIGNFVIVSGIVNSKIVGGNLTLFGIDGVVSNGDWYGCANSYQGACGKCYSRAAVGSTSIAFDLPTANENYNFLLMFLTI